jgi:hypothetical protein
MLLSPLWEVSSCVATQRISQNTKRISQNVAEPESSVPCSLVPILNLINPLLTTASYLCKIPFNTIHPSTSWSSRPLLQQPISVRSVLILSTHQRLGFRSGLFLLAFPPSFPLEITSSNLYCFIDLLELQWSFYVILFAYKQTNLHFTTPVPIPYITHF